MALKTIAPNLYIKTINNRHYWLARIQINNRRIDRSLGAVECVTLREAKRKLAELLLDPDLGKEKKPKNMNAFSEVWPKALDDIESVKRWKHNRSKDQWEQSLRDYAEPILGAMPVDQITVDDVLQVLKPIWTTKTETASRVRMRLEAVFSWAIVKGLRPAPNPAVWAGNLALFLPAKSKVADKKHHEAPTFDELKKVVKYCREHPSPVSGVLLLIIATAGRVTEIRGAEAREFVGDVWTVPNIRMKTEQQMPHRVPISELARIALEMGETSGYVFTADGKRPVALDSPRLKLVDILDRKVTVHGIRSTFRDWCARERIDDNAAEKCLAHRVGDATVQAYFRDDLFEQRRDIMARWATALMDD